MAREIIFHETDLGAKPVEEFLDSVEPAARAKVVRTLELVRDLPVVPSKILAKDEWCPKTSGKCARNMPGTFTACSR